MINDMRHIHIKVTNDLKARLERAIPDRVMNKVFTAILEDLCAAREVDTEGILLGAIMNRAMSLQNYLGANDFTLLKKLKRLAELINLALDDPLPEQSEALLNVQSELTQIMRTQWPASTR